MGARSWITNLKDAGQIRLLNMQLDRLFSCSDSNGKAISKLTEAVGESSLFLATHPVGSVFITIPEKNPTIEYGGEWEMFSETIFPGCCIWKRVN